VYDSGGASCTETLRVATDALDCAFSPDGRLLAVLALDCRIVLFDWRQAAYVREIDARLDFVGGRGADDVVTAETSRAAK
jgi:hypothetical protein